MTTSYNGWAASTDPAAINVKPLTVAGVDFPGGVKAGDVATVLHHVALQFHGRVERLQSPGCWGYSYRQNRNASNLSCHSSGTAIDCNAPKHPNGIEASQNFTKAQIAEIHKILAEVPELAEVVHWGGDWHRSAGLTPDPMHFEIHDHDLAKLARVADRIRNQEDDMATPDEIWAKELKSAGGRQAGVAVGQARAAAMQAAADAAATRALVEQTAKASGQITDAQLAEIKQAIADAVIKVDVTVHDQTGA